ncbi:MAG: GTP cyclohydrolase IIa [Candidatus Nezhaarchaeota archaeon]|nr:GTP cyclohydrolase IIa [Candidatus Nezhaarchaeota archaeon]
MIRLGLIHLSDYENWIKSMGYDREWMVQATQADIYRSLVIESAKVGAFSFPLTYDSYLTVINAVRSEDFERIVCELSSKVPIRLVAYIGLGETYVEAMKNMKEMRRDMLEGDSEETVVAHLDVDNYNEVISSKGFYYAKELIGEVIYEAKKISSKHGGLSYYAGGDNVICFIPSKHLKGFLGDLEGFLNDVETRSIKVGIGVAPKPRDALTLAAKALDHIRAQKFKVKTLLMRATN